VRTKFVNLILNDAGKEFADVVQTGFGQDGTDDAVAADFAAVRGQFDTNKFVTQMNDDQTALIERLERFKQAIANV